MFQVKRSNHSFVVSPVESMRMIKSFKNIIFSFATCLSPLMDSTGLTTNGGREAPLESEFILSVVEGNGGSETFSKEIEYDFLLKNHPGDSEIKMTRTDQ